MATVNSEVVLQAFSFVRVEFGGGDYLARLAAKGGRSRSRVSAKWPTRLLFTVYFTYTS